MYIQHCANKLLVWQEIHDKISLMNETIEWEIDEYAQKDKTADWFWALGIIVIAAAAASVLLGNLLFAVLIAIGGFLVGLYAKRPPDRLRVELSRRGVVIGTRLHPFKELVAFWVSLEGEAPTLILDRKGTILPHLILPIEDVSPDDVRLFLNQYLQEKELEDAGLVENIMERFGF